MLELIRHYGLALIFLNVLLEQFGAPIPSMPTLIVAGALSVDGGLAAAPVLGAAFGASMLADAAWFQAGRRYGRGVLRLLCGISLSPDSCVRQTETRFQRWGAGALVVTKFVPGLSTLARPLAGAMQLRWSRFLLLNAAGVALWVGASVGLGALLHTRIDWLLQRLDTLGSAAVVVVALLLAAYLLLRWQQRRQFMEMLRIARITVAQLRELIDGPQPPVIVDLRSPVVRGLDPRVIPGALLIEHGAEDPGLPQLPLDRDIVFYCSCPNEASAAAAARRLMGLGFTRVRPLAGGLEAWIASGHPVEHRS